MRKYFNYPIDQLENLLNESRDNIGILEEIQEELTHRKTKRAERLSREVKLIIDTNFKIKQPILNKPNNSSSQAPFSGSELTHQPITNSIDWDDILNQVEDQNPDLEQSANQTYTDKPINILESWMAVEAFSPQTYKRPQDLQGNGSVAFFEDKEPWFRNERSRPNCNLYYIVYLGAIELETATEKLISVYQDKRIERPAIQGNAALGAILVNKKGIPVPEAGIALSSFGWAYGQALGGHLDRLKYWEAAESKLLEELGKLVYLQDENGSDIALSKSRIHYIYKWIIDVCQIPQNDCVKPSFSIRLFQSFSKGEPEIPLLNSFYLYDLQKASYAVKNGPINKALSQYLGITKATKKIDILQDKPYLEDGLQPKNTPLGRWPSRGGFSLVLLQQLAVNLAKRELQTEGLFSVNGPPGTGKTTLLRDIVAHNVVERAIALSRYKEVDEAFTHAGQMKIGKGFAHFYQLSDSIRGFEMLVTSSNNKAVENISKELPLTSQLSDKLTDFSYFKTVSDSLANEDESTWGMIAAVLGNSKNRSNFINKVWWDEQKSLKTYFRSITGQASRDPEDYEGGIIPQVIEECDAPIDISDAKNRWQSALKEFNKSLSKAQEINLLAQKAYDSQKSLQGIEEKLAAIKSDIIRQNDEIGRKKQEFEKAKQRYSDAEIELNTAIDDLNSFSNSRPNFIIRLLFRAKWHLWCQKNQELRKLKNEKKYFSEDAEKWHQKVHNAHNAAIIKLDQLNSKLSVLENSYVQALSNIRAATHICGNLLVTPELWNASHETQQIFTPTFVKEAHYIRDDLFISAMKLHKAFIDAASKPIRQNLNIFFFMLGNGKIPEDKLALIPHLWSTMFLFTPVISTTFASVGRMLKKMPSKSIGWLLIDEAGQAIPQAAVGAIMRAKRVVAVGDPLQIEPVVTQPLPLLESIFKRYKVDPYPWCAPYSSVQTLSDEANPFGTSISRDLEEIRIGAPLLVHRRCENPMFKISNRLAYNGKMVSATVEKESSLTAVLGESQWIDVRGSAQEKWCPEEGELVAQMILDAAYNLNNQLDLFVITPFRIVAQSMRKRMEKEIGQLKQYGIKSPDMWINNNIGTVHTFQGKEAQGVILLLGATGPTQNGARNWATMNVNLLNVAVSRAKQNFYVVGNRQLWGDIGNMKIIGQYFN